MSYAVEEAKRKEEEEDGEQDYCQIWTRTTTRTSTRAQTGTGEEEAEEWDHENLFDDKCEDTISAVADAIDCIIWFANQEKEESESGQRGTIPDSKVGLILEFELLIGFVFQGKESVLWMSSAERVQLSEQRRSIAENVSEPIITWNPVTFESIKQLIKISIFFCLNS